MSVVFFNFFCKIAILYTDDVIKPEELLQNTFYIWFLFTN